MDGLSPPLLLSSLVLAIQVNTTVLSLNSSPFRRFSRRHPALACNLTSSSVLLGPRTVVRAINNRLTL